MCFYTLHVDAFAASKQERENRFLLHLRFICNRQRKTSSESMPSQKSLTN